MNDLYLPIILDISDEKRIELQASDTQVCITFFYLDWRKEWQVLNCFSLSHDKTKLFIESLSESLVKSEKISGTFVEKVVKRKPKKVDVYDGKPLVEIFNK